MKLKQALNYWIWTDDDDEYRVVFVALPLKTKFRNIKKFAR